MHAFVRIGRDTSAAKLTLPEPVIDDVIASLGAEEAVCREGIASLGAEEAVCREGIDAVAAEHDVQYIRLFAVRTKPVAIYQLVLPQIHRLHAVGGGQIRGTTVDSDVIHGLALGHVFVVEVADILHPVGAHEVYPSARMRSILPVL